MPDSAGASSSNEKELEEFRIIARSILMPFKQGCSFNMFSTEFYETCGESVPYRKFGFTTMQDLFRYLPDVARLGTNRDGQQVLFAVSTEDTQHVHALVRGQKSAKRPAGRSFSASRRLPVRQSGFHSARSTSSQPRPTWSQSVRSSANQNVEYFQFLKSYNHPQQQQPTGSNANLWNANAPPRFQRQQNQQNSQNSAFTTPRPSSSPVSSRRPSLENAFSTEDRPPTTSPRSLASDDTLAKRELEQLAKDFGLNSPVYRLMPLLKGQSYMCSIKIGHHPVSSVKMFPTAGAAEVAAAKNAIIILKQQYATTCNGSSKENDDVSKTISNKTQFQDETARSEDDDKEQNFEEIVENILQLLNVHASGVYSSLLSQKYFNKYKTSLPSDWVKQIEENFPEIAVMKIDNQRVIVSKNTVPPRSPPPPHSVVVATAERHHVLLAPTSSKNAVNLSEIPENEPETVETSSPIEKKFDALSTISFDRLVEKDDRPFVENSAVFTNIIVLGEKRPSPSPSPLSAEKPVPPTVESVEEDLSRENALLQQQQQQQQPRRSVTFDENIDIMNFTLTEEERSVMFAPPMIVHSRQPLALNFPDEVYFQVVIVLVVSPGDFVFRLVAYEDQFTDMRLKMEQFYSNNEGDPIEKAEDLKSLLFAAKAEDCWNRVSILDVLPEERAVRAYYIDHGDEEIVPFENVRQLEPEFVGCPAQAVKACLKGFETWTFDDFDEDVVQKFRDLTLSKYLTCERCFDSDQIPMQYDVDTVISVLLYGGQDQQEANEEGSPTVQKENGEVMDIVINEVIEALIPNEQFSARQNGVAVANGNHNSVQPSSPKTENPFLKAKGPTTLLPEQSCNGSVPAFVRVHAEPARVNEPTPSKTESSPPILPSPVVATCPEPTFIKVASPTEPARLDVQEVTDLQPFTEFGREFEALVVFAADPFEFTVQPVDYVEKLNDLTAELENAYEKHRDETARASADVKTGDFCVAYVNGAYFRAYCANDKLGASNKLSMFLVDYGEFYTCSKDQAYFLKPEFRRLPMLSVQCSLHGVQPFDTCSRSFDVVPSLKFGEKVTNGRYRAVVRSNRFKTAPNKPKLPDLDVDLVDPGDGSSVADWLIAQKLAAPKQS